MIPGDAPLEGDHSTFRVEGDFTQQIADKLGVTKSAVRPALNALIDEGVYWTNKGASPKRGLQLGQEERVAALDGESQGAEPPDSGSEAGNAGSDASAGASPGDESDDPLINVAADPSDVVKLVWNLSRESDDKDELIRQRDARIAELEEQLEQKNTELEAAVSQPPPIVIQLPRSKAERYGLSEQD
jgi:hypothetical protein